ncbi:MAG: LacI family DNA-binding transcriptional regulator [Chloroflexi bacterium]|nr:LacI family DNA-binding transcriptional regulator [Chloroflexota bacterium]
MAKSKATMRDVAQVAEVSATTVWMVVHNKPGIPEETIEKVRTAIEKLSYVIKPDQNGSKTESVGLLIEQSSIPAISDVFYGDVIRGFQAEAGTLGYHVLLSTFDRNTQDLDLLKTGFAQTVAGFAVANDGDILPEMVIQLQAPNVPVVLIESHIEGQKLPCVLGDNFMAGYKIARHMLDRGHRKIAILKGPSKYSSLVDRFRGCLAAMAESYLLPPAEWMPEPVSGHPLKGYVQMKAILELRDHPTAVIAVSDKTAFGAIEAIREAGLSIPGDIAIASIDNTRESGYTRPPLTTVHIPKFEIGVLALRKLHRLIEGKETIPIKSIVYSELVVRESS